MDDTRLEVRPLVDSDNLDELHVDAPGWFGEATLRAVMASDDLLQTNMVGLVEGVLAGYAYGVGAGVVDGRRGPGWVYVLPSAHRLGLGKLLWAEVLEVCTPDRVAGVLMVTAEDDTATQQVATELGMTLGGLHLESRLDLTEVSHLTGHTTVSSGDVSIRPFPPDATDKQWHEFVELFWKLSRDTPDQADGADETPESIVRSVVAEPWQVMGAWVEDRLVGFTTVFVTNTVKRSLNTNLTALEREYRGRGLSTAMKAAHAVALADAGWTSITTQNMEGNHPILAANRRLGYEPTGGLRDLVYDF